VVFYMFVIARKNTESIVFCHAGLGKISTK
jgi:hypothetical protein